MLKRVSLTHFIDGIAKTGFPFEHHVSALFRRRGWDVRHGTYYIDDVTDDVREIDIIAEKCNDVDGLDIHTVCIISCKKSDQNTWVMLAHERSAEDWLRTRRLRQVTTNDDVLRHMTGSEMWPWDSESIGTALEDANVSILTEPDQSIFAFQEMSKTSGTPQNDRAIFAAVTSLLKAQAYEIASHDSEPRRVVYQYNLLSAVDSELVRLDFPEDGNNPSAVKVDRQTYLADYIVGHQPISAPIRFVTRSALEAELAELDALHALNVRHFPSLRESFYPDSLLDWQRRKVFEPRIVSDLLPAIRIAIRREALPESELSLGWNSESSIAVLKLGDGTTRDVDVLNGSADLRARLEGLLKTHYRYEGPSQFELTDWFAELKAMVRERTTKAER